MALFKLSNFRISAGVNISFKEKEGDAITLQLNEQHIYVATGAACDSRTTEPSHVVTALQVPHKIALGSVRFSLGKETTEEDIDYVLQCLHKTVL